MIHEIGIVSPSWYVLVLYLVQRKPFFVLIIYGLMMKLIEYFIFFIDLTAAFYVLRVIFIPLIFSFLQATNNTKTIRLTDCELFVLMNAMMLPFSLIVLWLPVVRIVTLFILLLTFHHYSLLSLTVARVVQTTSGWWKASDISPGSFLISKILGGRWLVFSFFVRRHHRFFL